MKALLVALLALSILACSSPERYGSDDTAYTKSEIRRIFRKGDEQEIQKVLAAVGIIRTQPVYPLRLAKAGIRGWTILEFTVTAEGRTTDIVVIDSSPADVFDSVSIEAVEKWRYPARIENGKVVEVIGVRTKLNF